jgi:hypothetical protein
MNVYLALNKGTLIHKRVYFTHIQFEERKTEITMQSVSTQSSSSTPSGKKTKVLPTYIHNASTLSETCNRIYLGKPKTLPKHQNKIVSISPSEHDTAHRVTVICDGGGYIPLTWGVSVSQYGGIYLNFPINNEMELKGLKALDDRLFENACNDEWWPERPLKDNGTRAPSREMMEESYNGIVKPAKEKKDGDGFYTPICKVGVPLVQATGEVASSVKIVDHEGNPVSIHSLHGRKFDRIVFEIHYCYFKAPTELGPVKKLKYVRLADDGGAGDPDMFDDLNHLDDESTDLSTHQDVDAPITGEKRSYDEVDLKCLDEPDDIHKNNKQPKKRGKK